MKRVLAAVTLFAAFLALTNGARAGDAKPLEVPGFFRVDSPGPGYEWKAIKTMEVQGTQTRVFACAREGSNSRVVLTMQEKTTDGDARRMAAIKGHYNGTIESLRKRGFTALVGEMPARRKPVPEVVTFRISAKSSDGTAHILKSASIFKKNTYLFQVSSAVPEEAERLFKLAETIEEVRANANPKTSGR